MHPQSMFGAKIKKYQFFLLKIFIFYNFKNLCIWHGHVFIMYRDVDAWLLNDKIYSVKI